MNIYLRIVVILIRKDTAWENTVSLKKFISISGKTNYKFSVGAIRTFCSQRR